jgi:glycosyltransferase involved in cell wall biosynthesis
MPEVSVILPAYNAENSIERAVRSILNQTFENFELILIDDGSDDRTASLINGFGDPRIRILRNRQNLGLTASLNRGLKIATGALIARQDADDYSLPERIEKQIAFSADHPDVALWGTWGREIRGNGRITAMTRATADTSIRWESLFYNSFIHTSVMFRKSVIWEELGGYDDRVSYCQDYELWSRVMANHRVANLNDVLIERHVEHGSMTATMSDRRVSEAQGAAYRHFNTIFDNVVSPEIYTPLFAHYFAGETISLRNLFIGTRNLLRVFRERYPETSEAPDFRETVSRRFIHTAALSWKDRKLLSGLAVGMSAWLDPGGLAKRMQRA